MYISWTINLKQVNLDIYKWSLHNDLMKKRITIFYVRCAFNSEGEVFS